MQNIIKSMRLLKGWVNNMNFTPHIKLCQFDDPILPITQADTDFVELVKNELPLYTTMHISDNSFLNFKEIHQAHILIKPVEIRRGPNNNEKKETANHIIVVNQNMIKLFHNINYINIYLHHHIALCDILDKIYTFKHTKATENLSSTILKYNFYNTILENHFTITNTSDTTIVIPKNSCIVIGEYKIQTLDRLMIKPLETVIAEIMLLAFELVKPIPICEFVFDDYTCNIIQEIPIGRYSLTDHLHYNGQMYTDTIHITSIDEYLEQLAQKDKVKEEPITIKPNPTRNIIPNLIAGQVKQEDWINVPLSFIDDSKKMTSIKFRHGEVIDVIREEKVKKINGQYDITMDIQIS